MARLKNLALAFADGFAALDALLGGIERPGSRDNLISNLSYPQIEVVTRRFRDSGTVAAPIGVIIDSDLRKQGIRALVSSLRAKASAIESAAALNDQEPVGNTHGK